MEANYEKLEAGQVQIVAEMLEKEEEKEKEEETEKEDETEKESPTSRVSRGFWLSKVRVITGESKHYLSACFLDR